MPEPPVIAIVGRPNVGKSTLFNRLIGHRRAIVDKESGITRDRLEEDFEWDGRMYRLIDLAGWDKPGDSDIKAEAMVQVDIALNKADAILMLVDADDGLTNADVEIGDMARRSGKPVILAANKSDHKSSLHNTPEFYTLGLGEPIPISALHSYNINELLDAIAKTCQGAKIDHDKPADDNTINIAIVGKQNVGKSTLMNSMLGEYRAIVSDIPGTTRDSVDARLTLNGREFRIVDTAGMKKAAKQVADVDFYSIRRAQDSLNRADVALLMLDVQDGVTATDAAIAGHIQSSRKAYVILANKWDLTSSDTPDHRAEFTRHVTKALHFLQDAPIVFTSGMYDQGIDEIFKWAGIAYDNWRKRLSTGQLNASLERYIEFRPPPAYRGKRLNFFYATQPKIKPPTIVAFVNSPSTVRQSYIRYLQKQLRAEHDFRGTPVEMFFKRRTRRDKS